MRYCAAPLLTLLLAACGGNKPATTKAEQPAPQAVAYFQVDPATAAAIRGSVKFEGKVPAAKKISMEAEEDCEKLHKEPVFEAAVLVNKDRALANAFVYIKSGLEGKTFAPPAEAVVLEQKGCQFIPRVVALRTGQMLAVKNSDPVSHNIHPMPKNNRDWNQQQPPQAPDLKRKFPAAEVMIPVKCNVHAWMKSYIGVLDHPFFAVTSEDGAFTLKGLPPGEYTIAAWHEKFGEMTQKLTVAPSATAETSFAFAGK